VRRWKTPDGRRLVEASEGQFHLLGFDGRLERSFVPTQGSVAEHLTTTSYFVQGSELRCRFTDDNWDVDDAPPVVTESVEMSGLVPAIGPE
jgi:hypothetical protein